MPPSRASAIQEQSISSTGSPPGSSSSSGRQTASCSHTQNGASSHVADKMKAPSSPGRPVVRKTAAIPSEPVKRPHAEGDDNAAALSRKSMKGAIPKDGPSTSNVNGTSAPIASPSKSLFRLPADQPAAQVISASDVSATQECGRIIHADLTKYPTYERAAHHAHECSSACLFKESHRGLMEYAKVVHSPLVIPLLFGWTRTTIKARRSKNDIREDRINYKMVYYSPCGVLIRSEAKLSDYLVTVKSILSMTLFSFRSDVDITRKFVVTKSMVKKYREDIADKQLLPAKIPLINCFSDKLPDTFNYSKKCVKSEAVVKLMERLSITERSQGCDCQGVCGPGCFCISLVEDDYGYKSSRLPERSLYIVECNDHCKCGPNCGNRVTTSTVQFPVLLYYYPTKGWGVRALCDIPIGTFMGFYLGKIITDQEISENNDKYLVALDYEKTVDRSHVTNPDGSISTTAAAPIADEENMCNIDGRQFGNVSRFFNHSCDPNLFAQNIHREMFSSRVYHIGFFTKKDVKAGDELCWDYAYTPHSIDGRQIKCMCGAANCRKFML
ncbi:histone-lysine N-methyltransferase met-2-like [Paramacrobiotus metropolitanus]|uniref:histone-lysine N-methyltransferase met-2-like n=1 Tax=Paramacrobiotus metropolitanus TaxID=2943436 RepID=UPI0024465C85|nr:histone-lysine N-methyltransferase met-2-like [Paramacrobiotus metropolitanus]XP_055343752.1 histone-lysine N-methyltransferase met-2-like [Paramacrobiotus metropolitanus]XP_055343753.1 histone-lysine N-methyltransferase met-2-like [Paramacrobiotus metropolitanus]